jgi:hypothetical protein
MFKEGNSVGNECGAINPCGGRGGEEGHKSAKGMGTEGSPTAISQNC